MTSIGYHCAHEQHSPSSLLRNARRAAAAGFGQAMCSDHFHPWSERQGQGGFAWSWLGAALEATGASFGTVCAPGQRYHPAVIAQAAATLTDMYPGRFWLALGSGEALNESLTGARWPPKGERQARLKECVDIMRALWAGETVTHEGRVRVKHARLYSRPAKPPPLIGACLSPATAEWMGGWADGIITVTQDRSLMREIVEAFRAGGGQGKPMFLQVVLSYAQSDEEALHAAMDQWRQAALAHAQLADLDSPAAFDAATATVSPDDVRNAVRVSCSAQQHLEWLRRDAELGFDTLFLHSVDRDQDAFIAAFAEQVLPQFAAG
ncbi:MAG TPA: TIGR03885 family FMN-dependent LLM class oxidoreductase [Noviherbaspirillum sp.]|uniref:TIGR03885 family FMN-dependent LLM class oxidoreductase n=1 Tax=Noviherbaspirillum sp. TaxID=1926288 RepID=UPI002D2EE633|nr:TIGR03885 family FMN-dependent LLM class oxidoreductase [Noviherbaspirillum sp.]HYD95216.1 TIGR03885 family FMN-dependent LLM class oxidoreductase [Noviherbaspirillum sp.]